MGSSLEITAEEAFERVDTELRKKGVSFTRTNHEYDIPNFALFYVDVVNMASAVLKDTWFYAEIIPYRETGLKPENMHVLCMDGHK